jgi:D-glycero-D-manno-heptose 1,7-bisphosphate phosphatase
VTAKLEAVFLDRDGTLIENRHYLASPDGVALLPGVREAIAAVRNRGAKLFLFTNQSGVGRGYFTLADVEAVNRRMIDLLGLGADLFTAVCIAPERPDEPVAYRKPSPRFIQEMLAEHRIAAEAAWMVGDSPVDWQAGLAAGVRVAALVGQAATVAEAEGLLQSPGVTPFASLLNWARSL